MVESVFEGKRNMIGSAFEGKRSMLEQCFRSALKAHSSSDLERSVASKHSRAVLSMRRVATEHASAVIPSAQWLRSTLEQ